MVNSIGWLAVRTLRWTASKTAELADGLHTGLLLAYSDVLPADSPDGR